MGSTKNTKSWSYSAGERGRNRIRAYEDAKSKVLMLEFYEGGKRKRVSLGHRDRTKAKQQADEAAFKLGQAEPLTPDELTLQQLFDMYLGEVTPTKSARSQQHDHRAARLFLRCWGPNRKPSELSRREWDRFVEERASGRLRPAGSRRTGGVGHRAIGRDLEFLQAVLNWATTVGDGRGAVLLDRNPLKGLSKPKERSPNRPVLPGERYRAMLAVAEQVDCRFKLALVLAHETGHRIGAIRQLRWSDIDLELGTVRWRKSNDKIGMEHETPLTPAAVEALEEARRHNPGIGEAWVLPAPKNPSEPCSRFLVRDWWHRAERLAELEPVPGLGWHGLRRKFATELKDTPLKDLCQLGGWKSPHTVLACYQRPDEGTMRRALQERREVRSSTS